MRDIVIWKHGQLQTLRLKKLSKIHHWTQKLRKLFMGSRQDKKDRVDKGQTREMLKKPKGKATKAK